MKRLTTLVLAAFLALTAKATEVRAELSRTDGERIIQNVVGSILPNAESDKRLYYNGNKLIFASFAEGYPITNGAAIGLDYMATDEDTPENNADYKSGLWGIGYRNFSAAPDSTTLHRQVVDFLRDYVDPVVNTQESSWGAVKAMYND